MTFYYIHGKVLCSTHLKDVSSCSTWELTQSLTTGQRVTDFTAFSPQWNVVTKSLHSRLRYLCRRGGRKIVRVRGDGWPQGSSVFQTPEGCSYELTETAATRRGPHRFKSDGIPALRRACECGVPPLVKNLSIIDTCWQQEKKSHFFLQWHLTGLINYTSGHVS